MKAETVKKLQDAEVALRAAWSAAEWETGAAYEESPEYVKAIDLCWAISTAIQAIEKSLGEN